MDADVLVLGPVELVVDGRREMYGSAKVMHMLAVLALNVGRSVPLTTLARRLWDDMPPRKPNSSLHSYATRIRSKLGTDQLLNESHAYALDIDPDRVDFHRYVRLTTQARSLADSGDATEALALLRQATGLWRGEPLTGITGPWAEGVRRDLAGRRLTTRLLRAEIELGMGRFAAATNELAALLAQRPTDETVTRLFMTAAYGSGRQSDALRAYDTLRSLLRQEGTEPGGSVGQTHRLILEGVPVSNLLPGRAPGADAHVPNNLPAVPALIGREEELGTLRSAPSGVIALHAVSGMAGVGKTSLALHTAMAVAPEYPGGQLYINLRAHAVGQEPMSTEAALATLLRQMGVPVSEIPLDLEGLIALWHTVLSTRRAVIVLDDTAGADQIRPLLPGNTSSLILITSRRRISALPGVRNVFLDVLPTPEALSLFTGLVGPERAKDEHELVELVQLCGHLPLALELVAGRLNSRPTWTIGHLIERMSDGPGRLSEIRDGDTEIFSAFALSYDALTAEEQRVFRLLSLHYGDDFGPHATAALADLPLSATERILESLLDSHLLREPTPDRYRLHDLIKEFSASLAEAQDDHSVRKAALDRLCDFYLCAATEADLLLFPRRPRRGIPLPSSSSFALPSWQDPQKTKAWLGMERSSLVAAERHSRTDTPERAAHLAHVLAGYLDSEGFWEATEIHTAAIGHWRRKADQPAEARALVDLTTVQFRTGSYEEAERNAGAALELAQQIGDSTVEAESLRLLGLLYWDRGRLHESLEFHQRSLNLRLDEGDTIHIAGSYNNVGITLLYLGDHEGAQRNFQQALLGFTRAEERHGEAQMMNNLGDLQLRAGDFTAAREFYAHALDVLRETGGRWEVATTQMNLATTLEGPDHLAEALELHRQAVSTFRQISNRRSEAISLNAIGRTLYKAGRYAEASAHHKSALDLAREIGAAQDEGQALQGLAMAEFRTGRTTAAADMLSSALCLARAIDASEEEARCRACLGELSLAGRRWSEATEHLRSAISFFADFNRTETERLQQLLEEAESHEVRA